MEKGIDTVGAATHRSRMRGQVNQQPSMLMLMSPESLVPAAHPIRRVKTLADDALRALSPVFDQMYSKVGRGSIPPERLLKASLLMALYSVRSERLFCEQLGYNLLFRWFLDMDMDEGTFDATVFSKNRGRLLKHDVAGQFFAEVVQQARRARLVSAEHFTVDGTLIEAWASLKSFRRKEEEGQQGGPKDPPDDPGNPEVDFHGEKRSNETHESSTDPESRLARKGNGKEAKLCFSGHSLMENRNGLLVDFRIAGRTAEAWVARTDSRPGYGDIASRDDTRSKLDDLLNLFGLRLSVRRPEEAAPVEEAVFRVVQEATTNVLRHASARRFSLALAVEAEDAHRAS